MHKLAMPVFLPLAFKAPIKLINILAPDAPIGWPSVGDWVIFHSGVRHKKQGWGF